MDVIKKIKKTYAKNHRLYRVSCVLFTTPASAYRWTRSEIVTKFYFILIFHCHRCLVWNPISQGTQCSLQTAKNFGTQKRVVVVVQQQPSVASCKILSGFFFLYGSIMREKKNQEHFTFSPQSYQRTAHISLAAKIMHFFFGFSSTWISIFTVGGWY